MISTETIVIGLLWGAAIPTLGYIGFVLLYIAEDTVKKAIPYICNFGLARSVWYSSLKRQWPAIKVHIPLLVGLLILSYWLMREINAP